MNTIDYAMTIKEVAEYLSISNQMVYNMIHEGELPAFKVGNANRIMHSDLQKYIEREKKEFSDTTKNNTLFTVENLSLSIGSFNISDINFSFPRGKILSLLGSSGSGKTCILKAIAGLLEKKSGQIYLGRERIDELLPAERKIGYVFEDYALFPHLTGKLNIEFPLSIRKKAGDQINKATLKLAQELDIDTAYLSKLPEYLPEGIKQLVAIAKGKNHEFDLFIMDEPMSQLDAAHHVQMRMFLQKFVREMQQTTIISFNDPADALALSDYLAVIENGRLLQFAETWQVYNHPQQLRVLEMISALGVNTIPVEIIAGKIAALNLESTREDGSYLMAFRPEEVEVDTKGIKIVIEKSSFYNHQKKLVSGTLKDNPEMQIKALVPLEAVDNIKIMPKHPYFFNK